MFRKYLAFILCLAMIFSLLPSYTRADSDAQTADKKEETHVYKELEDQRTAESQTFTDGEGNFRTEVNAKPIFHKKNGKWEAISDQLVEKNDPDAVESEDTDLQVKFPKNLNGNKKITYTYGDHHVSVSVVSGSDGKNSVKPDTSSKVKIDDNKITYEDVFPGIDLRHVAFDKEVKEDWIIHNEQALHEFTYQVDTDLNAKLNKDGSIGFYQDDQQKENVFELPSPMMEDSNIIPKLGNGVQSTDLHYELTKQGDQTYQIRLVVSKDWLSSKERKFPIYIDPSITTNSIGDTFISSAYPNSNYNKVYDNTEGEYILKVGKYDGTTGTNYAYIQFSLEGVMRGAIIDSADLQVYVTHAYNSTIKTPIWVDRVQSEWNSNVMTWSNRPATTTIGSSPNVGQNQWAHIDLKKTVQDFANGLYPNHGFKLHENGNGQTYWKKITAAESPNTSKMVINYHYNQMKDPTVTASPYTPDNGTGWVNVSWPSIYGASSYDLQMWDGKGWETVVPSTTATSWSSKGKKIFPKAPYSTSSVYKTDATGVELAEDPSAFFSAKSGVSTTRKEYGFRVLAHFPSGDSPVSNEVKRQILVPDRPTVTPSAYPETDSTNKGRGWLDISWNPVPSATGYKVLLYNGTAYKEYAVGNVTSWSTKGQKLWPTDSEISAGGYTLHDLGKKDGAELPIDPNPVYVNANNGYQAYHRYSIRIKATINGVDTDQSESQYGYIPLNTPKNVTATGEVTDYVNNKGKLNVTWSPVTGVTDLGGYKVEISDGVNFKSFDVGNVTEWSTEDQELFDEVMDLPVDPTADYQKTGAPQSLIDKKAYDVRVRAYRLNDDTAPAGENTKMSGDRGLSSPSTDVYGSIPFQEDLLGLEDYFTYGTHDMANGTISVNVTTGNYVMEIPDQALFTRGVLGFTFTRYYNSRSTRSSVLGQGWTFTGNESLQKTDSTGSKILYYDEDGTLHTFVYNSTTNSYDSPKGKYLTLTQETVNNNQGYRLKDIDGFSKVFDVNPAVPNGYRLDSYQDKYTNKILFSYSSNQLVQIAEVDSTNHPIRTPITFTYTSNGLINTLVYKDRTIQFTYVNNQLTNTTTTVTGSTDSITNAFSYNSDNGELETVTDSKGNIYDLAFDNEMVTVDEPETADTSAESTEYQFDDADNVYTVSTEDGTTTTTYKRDTVNNTYAVAEIITEGDDPDDTEEPATTEAVTNTYDGNYNVLSSTDIFTKVYPTSQNKPSESTQTTETSTYDSQGNVKTFISKDNKTTSYNYDLQNRITDSTDPNGTKTNYVYTGNTSEAVTVGNEVTQTDFDTYGRTIKVTNPNNTYVTTTYDDANNKVIQTDEKGQTDTKAYNDYGSLISDTDAANKTVSYDYDPLYNEQITTVTDEANQTTNYQYDGNGNLQTTTDANNKSKTYDSYGNDELKTVTLPNMNPKTITYDKDGNPLTISDTGGVTQTNTYDYNNDDQITAVDVSNTNNHFQYSNEYTIDGKVQKTSLYSVDLNDPTLKTLLLTKSYEYNTGDLLTKYTQGNYQINYQYDNNGQTTETDVQYTENSVPWQITQGMTYTPEGKPSTLSVSSGSSSIQDGYSYDLINNKSALNVNNGLYTKENSFNVSNQVTSIVYKKNGSPSPDVTYSYDYYDSGNIKTETSPLGVTTYHYDPTNQLIDETLPDGTTNSYTYDTVGNRLTDTRNGVTDSFHYNDANQIATKNTIPYSYDGEGNLTQDEKYKYQYNSLNEQTKVTDLQGNSVASYEYDEDGLRTKKIIGSDTHEYYYESENLSLEIIRDSNGVKQYRYYQWDSAGKPLGMILRDKDSNGIWQENTYHFWTNYRGDVISILDNSGNEVGSYNYDAFGNVLSETGDIAKENPIRYAGYYYDKETKHYYLQARYYNPENGNFQALDSDSGDDDKPLTQNGYTYVSNNPIMLLDLDGRKQEDAGLVGGGGSYGFPARIPYRWSVGDPIDAVTSKGKSPSWSTVRSRYWKNEAHFHAKNFSSKNLERMEKGKAPKDVYKNNGKEYSRELHHKNPRSEGGSHSYKNLEQVTPWEHARIDRYRYWNI